MLMCNIFHFNAVALLSLVISPELTFKVLIQATVNEDLIQASLAVTV